MGLGRAGIVGGTSKLMIYKYSSPPGFAGAERCLRVLQGTLSIFYGRVRTAEHASRDPRRILEHRHGLSEIVERGAGVLVRRRVRRAPDALL